MHQVAVARLNTLLHRPPDYSLPPPPRELPETTTLPEVARLRWRCVRAPTFALAERIKAEQALWDWPRRSRIPISR